MLKSKLFQQLRSFDKHEQKEFKQFIAAPFFNSNKALVKLYNLIFRYPLTTRPERLEKKTVAERLFQKSDAAALQKLRETMSGLSKLVEEYIIWKELKEQPEELNLLLLKANEKRGIDKQFFKVAREFDQYIENQPTQDVDYFLLKYRLNKLVASHLHAGKFMQPIFSIESIDKFLDLFIVSAKYKHFIVSPNQEKNDKQVNESLKKEIPRISEADQYKQYPIFQIYNYLYRLPDLPVAGRVAVYQDLQRLMLQHLAIFSKAELDDVIILLLNQGYQLTQQGIDDSTIDLFRLHQFIYEKELLLFNQKMISGIYLNTVRMGCNIGEVTWVKNFITATPDLLNSSEKEYLFALANAYLACSQKEYDKTLELLRNVEFLNLNYSVTAKFLIIRCYYEQEMDDSLFSFLQSFERFVRRQKKITDHRKKQLLNFVKFTRKLSDNLYIKDYTQKDLLEELEGISAIFFRSWLKKMIRLQ